MILQEFLKEITPSSIVAQQAAEKRWQQIAKPLNGLGHLEDILIKIASLTENQKIQLSKRCVVPLCADNGVVEEGITQTDKNVTAIVTRNFSRGKTSACIMAKSTSCDVIPVDIGVAEDLTGEKLIHHKISYGTKNFTKEPAMNRTQALIAILFGIRLVRQLKNQGYRLIATGEMGIGNTTTSSAVASVLLQQDPAIMTGPGAGLSPEGIARKIQAIQKGIDLHQPDPNDPIDILQKIGGYDIAGMCGIFLGGAIYKVPILLDGLISGVAALCAARLAPNAKKCMIASHLSSEKSAELILKELGLTPLIHGNFCLGEGTGAIAAIPLLDMACAVYDGMPTFEEIAVKAYVPLKK